MVGRLVGGLAHDFNNLLTVVIGNLDLALERLEGEARRPVETALRAAQRTAALVHRLVAFAGRQTLIPETLDLNRLTTGMEDRLRPMLGEAIDLELKLRPELWPASADRSQVEAALLQLASNARDAMPAGGRLTIATDNVHLDAAGDDSGATAGDYVMLDLTDTGTGMPPHVLENATEPFFTTKEVGQGSGLGLSMIYGFARQSGGRLAIYSAPGHGTAIRLYLPRAVVQRVTAARPFSSSRMTPRCGTSSRRSSMNSAIASSRPPTDRRRSTSSAAVHRSTSCWPT
ncbi:MAG: ATP-binding protein [Dongiaceae bacterium]